MGDKPISAQKIDREYGWDYIADYGKQGVSVAHVYVGHGTAEEAARNRENMNRVLRKYGYQLTDKTKAGAPAKT